MASQNALAQEFLTLDDQTKARLVELAARLLPQRELVGQSLLSIFKQSATGRPGVDAEHVVTVTDRLLRLFFDHVRVGDFEGYYRAITQQAADYPSGELPHGLLMLALHQFEQAALPFVSGAYADLPEMHGALVALDRLCDNAIVLIASSYFETSLAESRALQQVTDTALSTLDLEQLMESLVQSMAEASRAECGVLALRDEVGDGLGPSASWRMQSEVDVQQVLAALPEVAAQAMASGEAIQISGQELAGNREDGHRLLTTIYLPLMLANRAVGLVCLARRERLPFDSRTTKLLQVLAERAAAAIDHARLYRRTTHLLSQTEALQRVTASITSKMALSQVLEVVLDGVVEIFGATRVAIFLEEKETGKLHCPASRGVTAGLVDVVSDKYGSHLNRLWDDDHFYTVDAGHDDRLAPITSELARENIGAILALPFGRDGEARGAICLFHDGPRAYGPGELSLGHAFADQAAIALANASLYREIREHAAELDRVNSELQILDRMKADFLAMISHELRTPLTAILGYTDLLLRGVRGELSDRQSGDLKTIRSNGNRLLSLINDLIDFSSIEAGRTSLHSRTLQVDHVLPRAIQEFLPLAQSRSITLTCKVAPDLPLALGDAAAVEKVVSQLMSNAIKFTAHGGAVAVSATTSTRIPDDRVTARAKRRGNNAADRWVVVTVSDTGIGIHGEQMSRIWDYFYQVDSSSARRFGGTGLGLAIAKRLVDMQGGSIWAESEGTAGKGSRFSFALRAAE